MSAALTFDSFDGQEFVRLYHGDDNVVLSLYHKDASHTGAWIVLTAAEALRLADALRSQAELAASLRAERVSGEEPR